MSAVTRRSRVLVFPSCNEPGLEVVDALRLHPRIEVWGGSSYDLLADPSRPLLDARHIEIPALGTPGFRDRVRALCAAHDIAWVFPTHDGLIAEMATWDEAFGVIAPAPEVAKTVLSKSAVYAAVGAAVPTPRAFDDARDALPAFAKPDDGSGSRGAVRLETAEAVARARDAGLLVQEFLPGDEYTVDCVGARDGQLLAASVRRRRAYGGGIALASTLVRHAEIEGYVAEIARALPIAGPWFAQFREDADGTPRLMEVNARVGGSSGATRLGGVNIPLLAYLAFTGVDVRAPRRADDVTVVRRLDRRADVDDFDCVIWDLDATLIHDETWVDPEMVGWLWRFRQAGKRQLLVSLNPRVAELLEAHQLPRFFERAETAQDKVTRVGSWLRDLDLDPRRVVMINDSGAEKLAFEQALPGIRTIAPDAIGLLHAPAR